MATGLGFGFGFEAVFGLDFEEEERLAVLREDDVRDAVLREDDELPDFFTPDEPEEELE